VKDEEQPNACGRRASFARKRTIAGTVCLAVALVSAGCSLPESTRDVRVTILDEAGAPIPGALFYAEAYDEKGAFAFITGVAGDAGEVPDSAREPLKIPWRRGAKIALVAFAEGRISKVLRGRRIESDGALITLVEDLSEKATPFRGDGPAHDDPLRRGTLLALPHAMLGFPFEDQPELARRVAGQEHAALRAAFLAAYERWAAGVGGLSESEQRKLEFLRAISGPDHASDSSRP
jgi:hypothetical protein